MPKSPNTRLRDLMDEAGWNPPQLAAAVKAIAAEQGMHSGCERSSVSRWLSGVAPRPPVATYLVEALARKLGRPLTAQEAGLTSAPADAAQADLSWQTDPIRKLVSLTGPDADPRRRHRPAVGIFTQAALAVPAAASLAHTPTATWHAIGSRIDRSGRVGHGEVEHMRTMTRLFAQAAQNHGAGHTRPVLNFYLGHDVTGWLHAPTTETVHRQLLVAASQLTTLLGLMSADHGADALSQHCYRTAAHLAADADDTTAFAIALRALSSHAHVIGHHIPDVHHLAERAVDASRHAPLGVRAYTHAHLALMRAHHDRHRAVSTLADAERLNERADDTPEPFVTYPAGALYYQSAQIFATLGDRGAAVRALTASLGHRTPAERLASAITRARLAETLLAQGHLDAATVHWRAFVETYPLLHSVAVGRRLDAMRRLLRPHARHHTAARLLAETADLRP
ncbi:MULTISPECIES: hypothetical protein [unclassified Streptomyces]|uniref:hypothetical protein n=1 Tax=Streptomyces sp. NPDC127532 TaxID=3345399 RepID=UPI0036283E44